MALAAPLALRNKETIVPGDSQCLNHRSCESVLLIPPPRVPPGPRSSPLSTTHGSKQSNKQFAFANGAKTDQTQTPFSVCSTPGLQTRTGSADEMQFGIQVGTDTYALRTEPGALSICYECGTLRRPSGLRILTRGSFTQT